MKKFLFVNSVNPESWGQLFRVQCSSKKHIGRPDNTDVDVLSGIDPAHYLFTDDHQDLLKYVSYEGLPQVFVVGSVGGRWPVWVRSTIIQVSAINPNALLVCSSVCLPSDIEGLFHKHIYADVSKRTVCDYLKELRRAVRKHLFGEEPATVSDAGV